MVTSRMGSGVSSHDVDSLQPQHKAEIVRCIKESLSVSDHHDDNDGNDDKDKELMQDLTTKIDEKLKGAIHLRHDDSSDDEIADTAMSPAEIESISKQVSMMFAASGAGPAGVEMSTGTPNGSKSAAPGQRKDFRQRRLTFAMQRDRSTSANVQHITTIYCSAEIGEVRDITPPFPSTVLGTYSCHGIEPSWTDEGYTEKINQDRGCVVHPFRQNLREAVFCVFDGHGEHGDLVSQYVMTEVPRRLETNAKLTSNPEQALKEIYVDIDKALGTEAVAKMPNLQPLFSGTTAVVVYMRENTMWIANAGDSRAVLCTRQASMNRAVNLTRDHNPDLPEEEARILSMGGYVSAPPEEGLSARVWLDANCTQIGLAMSRSIGDHAVLTVGVIAEPEVVKHEITSDDQFIILASDGVWEFIPSQEAVDIVAADIKHGAEHACRKLIQTAADRWRQNEGDYRDDITALIVVLPVFPPNTA